MKRRAIVTHTIMISSFSLYRFYSDYTEKALKILKQLDYKENPFHDTLRGRVFCPRNDLTQELEYIDARELDAVARCSAVQHPCAAVIKYAKSGKTRFEVSFNHSPGEGEYVSLKAKEIDDYLKTFLAYVNQDHKACLSHVLQYSLLPILRKPPPAWKMKQDLGLSSFKDMLEQARQQNIDPNKVFDKYYAVLKYFSEKLQQNNVENARIRAAMQNNFEDLLMVWQDIKKLSCVIPSNDLVEIEVLQNPHQLHCEVNIRERKIALEKQGIKVVNYIGISKLSCYLCEVVVGDTPHRGTHGQFFWYKIYEVIKNNPLCAERLVKTLEFRIKNAPALFMPSGISSLDDFINAESSQIIHLASTLEVMGQINTRQSSDLSTDPGLERHINSGVDSKPWLCVKEELLGLPSNCLD